MAGKEDAIGPRQPNWLRRILTGIGALVALLLLIVGAAYVWLGTDSGRGFVAKQIAALSFESGMRIDIGRIDGSLFGAMSVHDLAIRDPKGIFLSAPLVSMDLRPLAYAGKHVDIRSLVIPAARLYRNPQFRPTPPSDGPLLPDLDIDVNRLNIGRLQIDAPVTGQRHLVAMNGAIHIADGRAQINATANAIAAPGIAGGDRLAFMLDAVPDANRMDADVRIDAPATGLVAGLTQAKQPLRVTLAGKGDWRQWDGRLGGRLGGAPLADVGLTARDGTFTARGALRPGLFLTGPARAMLEPVTAVNLTAAVADRRVRLRGGLASDNFTFGADGLVDLAASDMRNLQLSFRLLKPSVIATNLSGDAITAKAVLNGTFVAPRVTYALQARRAGFGATRIEGLEVSGRAALDDEQWRVPVHGRARRISGVNASVEPLLANVRLDGDLAYSRGRLLSDNIRLLSDRIDATAIIVADMNRALYTGGLKGRINGYQVESIGSFNLLTDVDLKSGQNGYFRLGGRVSARSTRLTNDGIKSFFGGNALIVADVGYDSNGIASLDRLSIAAPDFRLSGGRGRYGADGTIRFAAHGDSDRYGPLDVSATGSVSRPVLRIAAARPDMGAGLANVVATIRGNNGAYAVLATGETDYGPFNADVSVATGKGPLRIDIRPDTSFSGVGLSGRIEQTRAGPFSGILRAAGSGIDGRIALSSFAGKQRVLVDATANQTSLPGKVGFSADRAIIKADAVLYDRPQIAADVQLAGVRSGALYVAIARARVDYRGGRGRAQMLVEGRTRYPFRVAANARLEPALWRIALRGRVNGIDIATRAPMRIIPTGNVYRLDPATLSVDKGTLMIAGRYGGARALHARLDGVDLSIANPFAPGLGLGGKASGSIDYAQGSATAFPVADARLLIDDFTRSSLAAVSEPVDIQLVATLGPEGGRGNALIRRRGAAIGRMQAALTPLPPDAGSWSTRLLAAPLSGGVRYNGPADALFSLAALPDQSLKGPIGVAADFTGRVSAPRLAGVVKANRLTYENAQYGTRMTDMALSGRFTNDRLQVERLTARAGSGTLSAQGFVSLSAAEGFPVQLGIDLDNAQLATGQDLSAQASGQIRIVNGPGQPPTISGRITLPETRYRILRQGSARVATLTGIRRKPPIGPERISGAPEPMQSVPANWQLAVQLRADNQIFVSGMGLESEWGADIAIGGSSTAPVMSGGVTLVRGTLGFAGHSFTLQQGRITFSGGSAIDPEINIVAQGDVSDVTITITITGNATNPQIAFSSTPSLPQDELMARILFGNSVGELSAVQAVQLAASLNSLRGGKGGLNPLGVLQSASGVSRLRILGADKDTGRGTSLAVGQYISNDIYVEIVTDARGYTATQLEVALSKALSILSSTGSFGGSSVDLKYRKDY